MEDNNRPSTSKEAGKEILKGYADPKKRPYKCDKTFPDGTKCTKRFVKPDGLTQHVDSIHLKKKHRCKICEKNGKIREFISKSGLNFHVKTIHGGKQQLHICEDCGKTSTDFFEEHLFCLTEEQAEDSQPILESVTILAFCLCQNEGIYVGTKRYDMKIINKEVTFPMWTKEMMLGLRYVINRCFKKRFRMTNRHPKKFQNYVNIDSVFSMLGAKKFKAV